MPVSCIKHLQNTIRFTSILRNTKFYKVHSFIIGAVIRMQSIQDILTVLHVYLPIFCIRMLDSQNLASLLYVVYKHSVCFWQRKHCIENCKLLIVVLFNLLNYIIIICSLFYSILESFCQYTCVYHYFLISWVFFHSRSPEFYRTVKLRNLHREYDIPLPEWFVARCRCFDELGTFLKSSVSSSRRMDT